VKKLLGFLPRFKPPLHRLGAVQLGPACGACASHLSLCLHVICMHVRRRPPCEVQRIWLRSTEKRAVCMSARFAPPVAGVMAALAHGQGLLHIEHTADILQRQHKHACRCWHA